jgi:hypothetical protein
MYHSNLTSLVLRFDEFATQVKTRLQLAEGKAQHGLVGTIRTIVKEEGYELRI